MEEIQELKQMWVCVGIRFSKGPYPSPESLSYTRANAIKKFVQGSAWDWKKYYRKGWRCIRVNVSFDEVPPISGISRMHE
jgi:hypothetical protein